jgi:hypothetical protein
MASYRLLNALSKIQSSPLQNAKDSPEVILQDPTVQGRIATTRAVSLVKINSTDFQPFEVDYPVSLLAKRLHREQKTHQKGAPFGQEAWRNFLETPTWCQQYIKQFLEYGSNDKNFWSLLIVDLNYKFSRSWISRFRGKPLANPDDLVSVLVVFKHCKRPKEKPANGATRDEVIDMYTERYTVSLSNIFKKIEEKLDERIKENQSKNSSRSPTRKRDRTRIRSRTLARDEDEYSGMVEYGADPIYASPPSPSPAATAYQTTAVDGQSTAYTRNGVYNNTINTRQRNGASQAINPYNASNVYQPPTTYQNANPYQNTNDQDQFRTYNQRNSGNLSSDNLSNHPGQASYSWTEDLELVRGEDHDNVEINLNMPDDDLAREVMARYTGVWHVDEDGVAHEANSGADGGQPPLVAYVADEIDDYANLV